MRLPIKIVAVLGVVALYGAAAAVWLGYRGFDAVCSGSAAVIDKEAEHLLPRYLALGGALDADQFYSGLRAGGDAGPWLNPRIGWTDTPAPAPSELSLSADLFARVESWGEQWPDHSDDAALEKMDFSWMARIGAYGYWSLIPKGPLARIAQPSALTMPLPDVRSLQTWAKLRLLASKRRGDGAQGSREVRHLAWLCHSTEVWPLPFLALAMLRIDRRAQIALRGPWKPYDVAWLDDARAVLFAAPAYVVPWVRADLFERARSVAAGRCAALSEAARWVLLRRKAGVEVPSSLEREYDSPSRPCRLDVARDYLQRGRSLLEDPDSLGLTMSQRALGRFFPKAVTRFVETVGSPGWFNYLKAR